MHEAEARMGLPKCIKHGNLRNLWRHPRLLLSAWDEEDTQTISRIHNLGTEFMYRDYTLMGASLPTSNNPDDPLLNLQAPINIGDPSESNVLLAQVSYCSEADLVLFLTLGANRNVYLISKFSPYSELRYALECANLCSQKRKRCVKIRYWLHARLQACPLHKLSHNCWHAADRECCLPCHCRGSSHSLLSVWPRPEDSHLWKECPEPGLLPAAPQGSQE